MGGPKKDTPVTRRLYAVYDAIDAQNFKLAVKLCSKKELSKSLVAQGLKAYALVNLSRRMEALEICESLWELEVSKSESKNKSDKMGGKGKSSEEDPENDGNLSTLGLVYTNTGMDNKALECADMANSRFPNKENQMNVFFACIAVGDYDKMQKMAMKLCTTCKDNNYLGWAATTALMHSVKHDDPNPENIELCKKKLRFAEMLLQKRLNTPAKNPIKKAFLNGALMTTLRLEIFVLQRKFKEALDLLEERKKEDSSRVDDDNYNNLEDEQKHVAAANVMVRSHVYLWEAEIKQEIGDIAGAAKTFEYLLTAFDADDWRNWSGYLENSLQCAWTKEEGSGNSILNEQRLLETEKEIYEFIQKMQEKAKMKRGPILALVSLRYRVMLMLLAYEGFLKYSGKAGLENASVNEAVANFTESMCRYFEVFASKACCFGDIRNFLLAFIQNSLPSSVSKGSDRQITPAPPPATHIFVKRLGVPLHEDRMLAEQSRRWDTEFFSDLCARGESRDHLINFTENLLKEVQSKTNSTMKEHIKSLRTQTCLQQILRYIGCHETKTDEALWEQVEQNMFLYKTISFINEEGTGGEKEIKQGDDLLILTAHIIKDIADRYLEKVSSTEGNKEEMVNTRRTILLQAASLLEYGVQQSPYSFQIRIALIEIYAQVGGFLPLVMHYNKLGIKNIQLDSMSYLVLGHALRLGFFEEARQAAGSVVDFWWGSHKTNPRYIKKSFEYSNFPKVSQLCRLDRLQHESHQLVVAAVVKHHLTRLLDYNVSWDKIVEYLHYEYFGYNKRYAETTNGSRGGGKTKPKGDTKNKVNDGASGEEMPWNPFPLGEVAKMKINKLVLNYDFNTPASWDTPIGIAAKFGRENIGSDWIAPAYARPCNGSQSYKVAWMNTSRAWFNIHVHLSLHLVVINGPLSVVEKVENLRRNIPVIRSGLLQVGLLSLKKLELETATLKQCLWHSLFEAVEISSNIVNVFETPKADESDIFLLHIQMEGLNSKLLYILEKLPFEHASASGNVLDTNRLVETSMAVSHAFMWIVSLVRCWTGIVPKPKKKKNKSDTEDTQVDKRTIQTDMVAVMSMLIKIFKAMNEHFSAMRPALASSEACEPFIAHVKNESQKYLKDLIPSDIIETTTKAVLKSYEKSFLNFSVITLQYISFLKESKFL